MIRSTARSLLRRQLQDVSEQLWTDTELNDLLNEGCRFIQKEVIKVDPFAFMYIDTAPLVANTEFYPLPDGFWYELEVGIKDSSSATLYTPISRGQYDRDSGLNPPNPTLYDIRGRYITFMPIPDYSVSPGYQLQYMPTISWATDAIAPDIHQALHMGIVWWAKLIGIGESLETGDQAAAMLNLLIKDIPEYYHRGGNPPSLRIDTGGPVYRTSRSTGNPGQDFR